MKSRAGLKKQVKTIRGGGHRTYWVKSSPKVEARKGNRQISAGEMLKAHGLQIAARGAAHGVATYTAQMAAIRAGRAVESTTANHNAGVYTAWAGLLSAGAASAVVGKRLAYSGRRGAAIRADLQRATIGGHIAASALHSGAATVGWVGSVFAHGASERYMRKRGRK